MDKYPSLRDEAVYLVISCKVVAGGGRGSGVSMVYLRGRSSKVGALEVMQLSSRHQWRSRAQVPEEVWKLGVSNYSRRGWCQIA